MRATERAALSAIKLNWVPNIEDIWKPLEFHVDGLNDRIAEQILECMDEAQRLIDSNPLGMTILGQKGAGKTHLMRRIRQEVQGSGAYFFLVSLLSGRDFWRNTATSMMASLRRPMNTRELQLHALLRQLALLTQVDPETRAQVIGDEDVTRAGLDTFVRGLRRLDLFAGEQARHAARALVLFGARQDDLRDIGESFLASQDEAVAGERVAWGMHPEPLPAQQVVQDISCLAAMTGPSLIAFDQIDTALSQSRSSSDPGTAGSGKPGPDLALLEQIGLGVMDLREVTRRTLTVVSCAEAAWVSIKQNVIASVADRFRDALQLERIPSPEVGRAIIVARFRPGFEQARFPAPYATWPIRDSAFDAASSFTPRQLLQHVDAHIRACLANDTVLELKTLRHLVDAEPVPLVPEETITLAPERVSALDAQFAVLHKGADVAKAFDPKTEDVVMPALLEAGLQAWIDEQPEHERRRYSLDPLPGASPSFHARLRKTVNESAMDEIHWAIRSVASTSGRAVINRVTTFQTIAGLERGIDRRRLYLLKTGAWPDGSTTQTRATTDRYRQAGGVVIDKIDTDDFKVFETLRRMRDLRDPDFGAWLRLKQPASGTRLFQEIFGGESGQPAPPPAPRVPVSPVAAPTGHIAIGRTKGDAALMALSLEGLRKHLVIFAGSGSGKTVLLRRIVEECALAGVSAIVLDPNNDLARLGEAWPQPPSTWWPGDANRAAEYLASTDVVVWTPRRELGRPLTFQPLPDFRAIADNADEFQLALDAAVAALAPRAKVDTATAKSEIGRAVLRQALEYHARSASAGLPAFLELLADLPRDVSSLGRAPKLAAEMAETLRAAMINDPLFGGAGEPLDPGVLLTPASGKRARISVVSFSGLPNDEQRQSFVNQLQMALFAWIKRHPAGERPLGGLFVMDEAQTLAPSSPMTACTHSTIALASQARKYGLGLVFATQAPKGIHNRIVGNAATQFYGFLNSPVQIAAAAEVAQSKGSAVLDISRLSAGQFYAVSEGTPFQKVDVPMCLTYHPTSALTAEEVMARAQRSDAGAGR